MEKGGKHATVFDSTADGHLVPGGDAIDAGSIEELYKFIYITNKLQIPWLNLIGNNDISIFGNCKERLGYTRQAGVSFYPVGSQSNFLLMHARERMISGFGPPPAAGPSGNGTFCFRGRQCRNPIHLPAWL